MCHKGETCSAIRENWARIKAEKQVRSTRGEAMVVWTGLGCREVGRLRRCLQNW